MVITITMVKVMEVTAMDTIKGTMATVAMITLGITMGMDRNTTTTMVSIIIADVQINSSWCF